MRKRKMIQICVQAIGNFSRATSGVEGRKLLDKRRRGWFERRRRGGREYQRRGRRERRRGIPWSCVLF